MLPDWNNVEDIEGFLRRNYSRATWLFGIEDGEERLTLIMSPRSGAPAAHEFRLSINKAFFITNGVLLRDFVEQFNDKWKFCAEVIHSIHECDKAKVFAGGHGFGTAYKMGDIYEEVLHGHIDDVLPDDISSSGWDESRREDSVPGQAAVEQSVRLGKRDNWWSRLLG